MKHSLFKVLNYNKDNYTAMSKRRDMKRDFFKTIDRKTKNTINTYFKTKENIL